MMEDENALKAGFVALVGRPSVGKSELMNALVGHKTSVVSPMPQMTRNVVRGIVNDERGQCVFLDTPGLHGSEKKFNKYMLNEAKTAIKEADITLYLIDASRKPGEEEAAVARAVKESGKPFVVALNKCDKTTLYTPTYATFLKMSLDTSEYTLISAINHSGFNELKSRLFDALPSGAAMYPDDYYTDQTPEFRIAEIVREKAVSQLREEAPHAVYVEVADLETHENTLWGRLFIFVETEGQKGMLVGKGAHTVKWIRIASLKELKKIFSQKISLDIKVKVDPHWRDKDAKLSRLFGKL